MHTLSVFLRRHHRALVWGLILLGALLRFTGIGSFPPGLNQDEASAGYEAWSLLQSGMDRNGQRWPLLFISWGSGQNVLYSYLCLPFFALLGRSTLVLRLPAALCGTLSLPLFYAAAKRVRNEHFALWALAALAVNPWHVLLSRWALESNLLPFCLLAGLYFLLASENKPYCLAISAAAFGLSLYAYGTAYLFLPLFLPAASLLLWRGRRVSLRCYLASLAIFALIALPITLCNLRNVLQLPAMRFLGFTLPALNETRQSSVTVLSGGGMAAAWGHFKSFLRLLWTQSDGLVWNSGGPFGLLYGKPGLFLALLGLGKTLYTLFGGRLDRREGYVLLWLGVSFLAAFFIDINVNRMNMAFLPLIWYQAVGLCLLGRGAAAVLLAVALGILSLAMAHWYVTDYAERIAPAFYAGLEEAVEEAVSLAAPDECIWVSWDVNMPYIYILFFEGVDAETYLESVEYLNPGGAFEWVSAFDRWRFGREAPADGTLCILPLGSCDGMEILAVCDGFAVARMPV